MRRRFRLSARGGFSLIEAAIATAIIGIGIVALMTAVEAGTRSNGAGRQLTQAILLAQDIREWTARLPFSDPDGGTTIGPEASSPQVFVDDLDDLMGVTYSPPRDGLGLPQSNLTGWSQTITLTWRDPDNLTTVLAPGASTVIHVQVVVRFQGRQIHSAGWLIARRE